MSNNVLTIDSESKKRESIFDNYLSKIEAFRISLLKGLPNEFIGMESSHSIDLISNGLIMLERTCQDLVSTKTITSDKNSLINNGINKILTEWYPIFTKLIGYEKFLYSFTYQ